VRARDDEDVVPDLDELLGFLPVPVPSLEEVARRGLSALDAVVLGDPRQT
jgi:hypothetical protein